MAEKEVCSAEVAEQEFYRFAEAMDLDVDPKGMSDDDKSSLESAKRRFVDAVVSGKLAVDEKGQPVFTPSSGDPIIFYEPTGASLLAADQKKKDHDMAKTFAIMGDMTRQHPSRFSKLSGRDVKVCLALFGLFMGG